MNDAEFQLSDRDRIRLAILREAPLNSWIALSNDESRMVAANEDALEVIKLSHEAGEDDPILIKTPPVWGEYAVGLVDVI